VTSEDLPGFHETFRSLQRVFPLRGAEGEIDRLTEDYFRTLRRFTLADVKAGADHWLAHGTKFPKPAEWSAAVPARIVAGDARQMTHDEAIEWARADRLGFEDQPCLCSECVRAGVDEKPLRFVPDLDGDDRDIKAFNPLRNHLVTSGHWAHGDELARWYEARATFYAQFIERFGANPSKLLRAVGREAPRPAVMRGRAKRLVETQ